MIIYATLKNFRYAKNTKRGRHLNFFFNSTKLNIFFKTAELKISLRKRSKVEKFSKNLSELKMSYIIP